MGLEGGLVGVVLEGEGIGRYIVWEQWGEGGEHGFGLLDCWEFKNEIDKSAEK